MTDFNYRASDYYSSDSSLTCTLNNPGNDGDIVFALITRGIADVMDSIPSGWAQVPGTTVRDVNDLDFAALYYKVLGPSEPASYDFTFTNFTNKILGSIYAFYGDFDPNDPFAVISDVVYDTINQTIRAASMNVPEVDMPVLWFGATYIPTPQSFTTPVFFTNACPQIGNTTSDMWHRVGWDVWSSSGSTGNMDGSTSTSQDDKHAFALALNLPSNGGGKQASCIGF